MYLKNLLKKSCRRRSARNDDATAFSMIAIQRLGATLLTYMNIHRDSNHSGCHHRKRKELTQHAVVCPRCRSRQVTVTIMMHAIAAFRISCLQRLMNVERREYQHRQNYCQQHPC